MPAQSTIITRPEAVRWLATDHRVDHQHHEERREQAEHVDEERRGSKLEDDRPHAGPERRIPLAPDEDGPNGWRSSRAREPSACASCDVDCQTRPSTTSRTVQVLARPETTTWTGPRAGPAAATRANGSGSSSNGRRRDRPPRRQGQAVPPRSGRRLRRDRTRAPPSGGGHRLR